MTQTVRQSKETMRALVVDRYGPIEDVELREMPRPVPGAGELLIRVRAASINSADVRMIRARPFFVRFFSGFIRPLGGILGPDAAGEVIEVGEGVTRFKPGDRVCGDLMDSGAGGFAEYLTTTENLLAPIPEGVSFGQAAALPVAGLTALQSLRDAGGIQPGWEVLIDGASGGVGTFAVQLAKRFGAEVTGVCSTGKLEQTRTLGADHVIDYTVEDFTGNEKNYDLILSCNGVHSIYAYRRRLKPGGTFVSAGGSLGHVFGSMILGKLLAGPTGKKITNLHAHADTNDLEYLLELVATGGITPLIERTYPLERGVEALCYVDAGHARGKIVLTMEKPI